MIVPPAPPHSSALLRLATEPADASPHLEEDGFALGCECADPPLQIESWRSEAAALPPRQAY